MITQLVYLKKYDWLIKVYYAVTLYYTADIIRELDLIDCSAAIIEDAELMMLSGERNQGFTYSDNDKHVTIMIIGLTDNAQQFANTYDHEKGHAALHIAECYGIDPLSEELLYLQGKIGQKMFPVAKLFMCDQCRNINFYNYGKIKIKS